MKPPSHPHTLTPSYLPTFLLIILLNACIMPSFSQVIPDNQTFSSDTIFAPFSGSVAVYSLKAYGNVNLYSDSSLVRIVLVDSYGNHWLVFESYPLITDTSSFVFSAGCDETCFLDGIVPDSIRIDLISAFLTLDSLKLDTNYIPNATELQAQAKWNNDSVKIAVMNQRIQEEHMYWRAGRNWYSDLYFKIREILFGKRFNNFGWDYYIGGIFERPFGRIYAPSSTAIITDFDWRHRHDADKPGSPYYDKDNTYHSGWLTINKIQEPCSTCYVFGPIGAAEGVANVFFNIHDPDPNSTNPKPHLDLNLSELQLHRCYTNYYNQSPPYFQNPQPPACTLGGNPFNSLKHLELFGAKDDETGSCKNYIDYITDPDINCWNACPDWQYNLKITGFHEINVLPSNPNAEFDLKEKLILTGPLSSSEVGPVMGHSMALVGFEIATEGMKVYQGSGPNDPDIILDAQCFFLGSTTWWFKDSRVAFPNYRPIITSQLYGFIGTTHYIDGVILTYKNQEPPDVQWADEDGDGYYWWGIGPKPDECPGDPDEEDCNDNDPNLGYYNQNPNTELLLYECTPICNHISEPHIISVSETIEDNRHFNRDVFIRDGAVLTIKNCTVSFSPGSRLVVQRGARLNLIQKGILTSKCDSLWKGIEVWGNSLISHSDPTQHGIVWINEGTVENAEKAVTTVKYEYNEESGGAVPVPTCSGGIIQADSAIFRNNETGAEFYPYQFSNISYFKRCNFETTNDYPVQSGPDYFIRMSDVHDVYFKGCSFKNLRTVTGAWGGGIYSFNSSVEVIKGTFQIPGYPPTSYDRTCFFEKLNRGIYGLYSGDNKEVKIEDAYFNLNYRGVYLSGLTEDNVPRIVKNRFKVFYAGATEMYPYGLYLDNCTGFHVEENEFWSQAENYNDPVIGLIVNNSGPSYNKLYRNSFGNIHTGIIAQNRNRSSDGTAGLEIKCNRFGYSNNSYLNPCKYDICVTTSVGSGDEIGIKLNQGSNSPYQDAPAGNVFSNLWNPYQWQFLNYCNSLNYWYHKFDGGYIIVPTKITTESIFPLMNTSDNIYNWTSSCPSEVEDFVGNPDSSRNEIYLAELQADSVSTMLLEVVDGGNTDSLSTAVTISFPPDSIPVRNELLVKSPYLSDTVMISAIEQEGVLSSEMITEILSSNPQAPKSDKIMNELSSRINPLTEEQIAEICEGLEIIGPKEVLEMKLSSYRQNKNDQIHGLIRYYKTYYNESIASDSIISLLTFHGTLLHKYEIVTEYLNRGDTSNATTILNSIPIQFDLTPNELEEHGLYEDYFSVRTAMIRQGVNILNPDSSMINDLTVLLTNGSSPASAYARAFLIANGALNYSEPIILPDPTLKMGKKIRFRYGDQKQQFTYKLFPNPASDYIILNVKDNTTVGPITLTIFDNSGRVCKEIITISSACGYKKIDVSELHSGFYIFRIAVDRKATEYLKITIRR